MQHTWSFTLRLIKSDVRRYTHLLRGESVSAKHVGPLESVRAFVLCQGLQASVVYRIGQKIYHPSTPRALRALTFVPYFLMQRWIEMTTGISLSPKAQIGPGLYIGHFGGIIIGPVRMGENCNLSHGVTLGRGVSNGEKGRPTLGDRVWIGPGAKVTGPVHLGNDCVIGANAVVLCDVPARSLAVGVPAKIKTNRASFDTVLYDGMDDDVARLESMALLDKRDAGDNTIDLDRAREAAQ
jgi:serine O-acetyltransferase